MMRVTIGVRLGLSPWEKRQAIPEHIPDDPVCDQSAPEWVEPEKVLRLTDLPSAQTVPIEVIPSERTGPPRVRGEMVWLKKDVAILQIEGRGRISPEEHSENRRR